jgi:hypothetical protein
MLKAAFGHLFTSIIALAALLPCTAHAQGLRDQIPASEYAALVALYNSTGGPGWKDHNHWLDPAAPSWHGVVVSGGDVTQLDLTTNNLAGFIPASFGNLTQLSVAYLGHNRLYGAIPSSIGNLSQLSIFHAEDNALSGSIPASIGNLTLLTDVDLQYNKLSGSIPDGIVNLTNLTKLSLNYNRLTGSIPASIGNLTQLTSLYLGNNPLTGTIPASIGNLTQLVELGITDTSITGGIPDSIGNLVLLTELYLNQNQLTGTIPASLGNLTRLVSLEIAHNQLTGGIPGTIGNLTQLTTLQLQGNQLTGPIPASLGTLSQLTTLYLHFNHLTGEFPSFTVTTGTSFVGDVSYNSLDFSLGSQSLANIAAVNATGADIKYLPQGSLIAAGGDLIGPTLSEKLLAAGPPAVDSAGDVAFRAMLSGTGKPVSISTAILLYSGTTMTIVASTGQPAPGAGGAIFSTLADPVLSGSGILAFVGTLKLGAGISRANDTGVWIATSSTTTLAVQTDGFAPSTSSFPSLVQFSSIHQIAVDDAGGLSLIAGLKGRDFRTTGLFGTDSSGDLLLLLYTGTGGQLSARSFSAFVPLRDVSGQSRSLDTINGNVAAFGRLAPASRDGIASFIASPTGFQENFPAQADTAVPGLTGVDFKSFDEPAINQNGDVAFLATLTGTGVNRTNSSAIFLVTGSGANLIARTGDPAPDVIGTGTAGIFSKLSDPVLNNNGAVAFIGDLARVDGIKAADQSGIWSNAGGTLQNIAQQGSAAPHGGAFSSFEQVVLPDTGDLVFQAALSGVPSSQNNGVWALWNGELTRVVGKGSMLELHAPEKTVKSFGIFLLVPTALGQSRSFDPTTGNLVFQATFTDGTWGIYEATPP